MINYTFLGGRRMKISNFYLTECIIRLLVYRMYDSLYTKYQARGGNINATIAHNYLQADTSLESITVRKHILNAFFSFVLLAFSYGAFCKKFKLLFLAIKVYILTTEANELSNSVSDFPSNILPGREYLKN